MAGERADSTFLDDLSEEDYLFTGAIPPPPSPSLSLLPVSTSLLPPALDLSRQTMTTHVTPFFSASSEAPTDALKTCDEEDGDIQNKPNKQLKPRKMNQKGPRSQFLTKTNVNNLDDGYRWNKYGRKSVKGSPFPRNYFRCTMPNCGVKKMVERSVSDTETLITTYVGIHTHPVPEEFGVYAASGSGGAVSTGVGSGGAVSTGVGSGGGSLSTGGRISDPPILAPYEQQGFFPAPPPMMPPPLSYSYMTAASSSTDIAAASSSFTFPMSSPTLDVMDTGLLEDMLPSHLRKDPRV